MNYLSDKDYLPRIPKSRLPLRWLAGGLLVLFAHCAIAQDAATTLSMRYPAGSVTTIEAAERAQEQAASENARIELQFAQDEQACRTKFFVNTCRDKAKERRRAALEPVRLVQIEADMAIRRMRVGEKDKALDERRREMAAEAAQLEQDAPRKAQETEQKQARNAEKDRERLLNAPLHAQEAAKRSTEHQAQQQRMQTGAAADAQKRAANVAAYDKKIKEAEAHQRDIAAKKAEKDRNRKTQPAVVPPAATTEGSTSPVAPPPSASAKP